MTLAVFSIREALRHHWRPQWITYRTQLPVTGAPGGLTVMSDQDEPVDHAIRVLDLEQNWQAVVSIYTDLAPGAAKSFTLRAAEATIPAPVRIERDGETALLISDLLQVRVPQRCTHYNPPLPPEQVPAPLLGIRRPDGPWLAPGGLDGTQPIQALVCEVLDGPAHAIRYAVQYTFADGATYRVEMELAAHASVLKVSEQHEQCGAGRMVLDLRTGHDPDTALWVPHRPTKGKDGPTYRLEQAPPGTNRLQPFYSYYPDEAVWWACCRHEGRELLGILTTEPVQWTNPLSNQVQVATEGIQRLEARFPLRHGTRRWLLLLADLATWPADGSGRAVGMHRLLIDHSQNPLDRVKDLILDDWPAASITHPRLLCGKEDVPTIRAKARSDPLFHRLLQSHPNKPGDPAGLYLATGDECYAQQAQQALLRFLSTRIVSLLSTDGYTHGGNVCIGFSRPVRDHAVAFDLIAASPSLSEDDRRYCRAVFAFLAYVLSDRNCWPEEKQGFPRGNVNFHSDWFACLAVVAGLLPGHPRQVEWLAWCEQEFDLELSRNVYPGGAWGEAPNYHGFTLHYLLVAAAVLRRAGRRDFLRDSRMRETLLYLADVQTPLDPRTGTHLLPAVGDTTSGYHSQSLQTIFAWAASLCQDDPVFAGRMMRAWHRSGSMLMGLHNLGLGSGWGYPLTLIDPSIPAREPDTPPRSRRYPGFGALLRDRADTPEESYFLYKCGVASGHYDADECSWHWYAHGVPLSYDFGCMYEPSIEQPWYHNTLGFDGQRTWDSGEVLGLVVFDELDFLESALTVTSTQRVQEDPGPLPPGGEPTGPIERGVAFISWRRDVLFVKGEGFIVVRDSVQDLAGRASPEWAVQVMADTVTLDQASAWFTGQHGVDLAVVFALPKSPNLFTRRWGYPPQSIDDWYTDPPPRSVSETQIALRTKAQPGAHFLALLFPVRVDSTRPEIVPVGEHGFRIRQGDEIVVAFLADTAAAWELDGIALSGRAALVRRRPGRTTVCLLVGDTIRVPEMTIRLAGPFVLHIEERRLRGQTDGAERDCFLHWSNPQGDPTVLVNDRPVYAYSTYDGYLGFHLPAGPCRFAVEYVPSKTTWEQGPW